MNRSMIPPLRQHRVGAVSLLCPWLQGRQVIVGDTFQSFLVGSARTPATVEATTLIEKVGAGRGSG